MLGLLLALLQSATAQETRVVVLVDTTLSMEQDYDAYRTSLLVTRLLADLTPGDFAAVRHLELPRDEATFQSRVTGEMVSQEFGGQVRSVEPTNDWEAAARAGGGLVLARPARGDDAFAEQLDAHLTQTSISGNFKFPFLASLGWFEQQVGPARETLIWLSDAKIQGTDSDHRSIQHHTMQVVDQLVQRDTQIQVVLFADETELARKVLDAGQAPGAPARPARTARTPLELMEAFAELFRVVIGAPYDQGGTVQGDRSFEMRAYVDEAWVVIYGNDTLSDAWIEGPSGRVEANYAARSQGRAGAYRVAHVQAPAGGMWTVGASGGGPDAAFAVIQLAGLGLIVDVPPNAVVGAPTRVTATLAVKEQPLPDPDPDLLAALVVQAESGGALVELRDDGQGADETAGDGVFSGDLVFGSAGTHPVVVTGSSDFVSTRERVDVDVTGRFTVVTQGGVLDFGTLDAGQERCVAIDAELIHEGQVPLKLSRAMRPPSGHRLELRSGAAILPLGDTLELGPGPLQLCLLTDELAASSHLDTETVATLGVPRSAESDQLVLVATWTVEGLPWWRRHLALLIALLVLAVVVAIVLGFVLPHRFPRRLQIAYSDTMEDLVAATPVPLKALGPCGIGFYRHARAYIRADLRVSRRSSGAVAVLRMQDHQLRLVPLGIEMTKHDGISWEEVDSKGERARPLTTYRLGPGGLMFILKGTR